MALVWQYGEKSGYESWKGLSWGMVPLHDGAFCACTWHFFYNSEALELVEAKENNEEEGSPMTMDQIFDGVLPLKHGYVTDLGPGPKPIGKRQKLIVQEKEEAGNRARAAGQRNEELMKEVAELKARQNSFEERLAERLKADMQNFYRSVGLQHIDTPQWMRNYSQNAADNSDNDEQ